MSIGKQTNPDGLELPAITICNETAYKNFEMNLDKESYLKNTLNLEDFFVNLNSEGTWFLNINSLYPFIPFVTFKLYPYFQNCISCF